ncbi:extracellular solute-binding protein [Clostridium sp.]
MDKGNQRWIVSILLASFFLTIFVGCDNSKNSKKNSDKKVTFKFFQATPGKVPSQTNRILNRITEKTGVSLQFEYLVGEVKQKVGVMISSGDLPDLIDAGDGTAQMINSGSFIPLENEINKYPNIKDYLGKDWEKMKNSKDGHIYFIPQFGIVKNKDGETSHNGEAFWIQKAVLKEFNYPPIPKTLDEYFTLIENYKLKYPTINEKPTIGFEILSVDSKSFFLTNTPTFLAGNPNNGICVVDPKTNLVSNFADKDASKVYYKKLNEVYNKGLIDTETFVQSYEEYLEKLSTGRVLGMVDQKWNFNDALDSLIKQNMIERTYVPCPITIDGVAERYADRPVLNINDGLGITTKCKEPARALKFIDELLSEENQKLIKWGEKDIDYKLNDNGIAYRTEEQRKQQGDSEWRLDNTGYPLRYFPHNEGFFDDGNAILLEQQPQEYIASLGPLDKEVLKAYNHKSFSEFVSAAPPNPVYYPMWTTNFAENAPETIAKAKIENLQRKYDIKMIVTRPEHYIEVWNEYIEELKKVDIKSYEEALNKEMQRRLKEWR